MEPVHDGEESAVVGTLDVFRSASRMFAIKTVTVNSDAEIDISLNRYQSQRESNWKSASGRRQQGAGCGSCGGDAPGLTDSDNLPLGSEQSAPAGVSHVVTDREETAGQQEMRTNNDCRARAIDYLTATSLG